MLDLPDGVVLVFREGPVTLVDAFETAGRIVFVVGNEVVVRVAKPFEAPELSY